MVRNGFIHLLGGNVSASSNAPVAHMGGSEPNMVVPVRFGALPCSPAEQ